MLNFREELKKIREGKKRSFTIEESAERLLEDLLNVLEQYAKQHSKDLKRMVFILDGSDIYVKKDIRHVTWFYVYGNNKKARKIFEFIKEKLKSENLHIEEQSECSFAVYID